MKVIVIGQSLTGKTTLIKYLKKTTKLPMEEIDDKIRERNKGEWPADDKYKLQVIAPPIIKETLKKEKIIFFTNTDYFTSKDLQHARRNGFRIILLTLSLKELTKRNEYRMNNEGYEDFRKYFQTMSEYQEKIKTEGLIDAIIDVNKPVEKVAEDLIYQLS
ncbi:MAG TPA: hypothetical protein VI998_03465 [Patescibacteria group bacterium]|nr:hypothetical protein [Patescibacteria group bacterium]